MKKWVLGAVLLASVFPLAAQTGQPVSIYVPEVAGYGISPSDNYFFTAMLRNEVKARNYAAVNSPGSAGFHLIGTLSPSVDDSGKKTGSCVFYVTLKNAATGSILVEQGLIYTNVDDITDQFTLLMFNIFSQNLSRAPAPPRDKWFNKWLYFGVSLFWAPRFYYGENFSAHMANFGGEVSAEIHFHPALSFETGLGFAPDWIVVTDIPGDHYQDLLLEIPLLLKYILKVSDTDLAELYGGFQINASLFGETKPSPMSFSAGCLFGARSEKGLYYIDPRLTIDLAKSGFPVISNSYYRTTFHIGIGYKTGVLSRRQPLGEHFRQFSDGKR